ncbi:uncharacterized protein LOC120766912 [Bactrocera tryoni]|uniref:uncharacterized protein LOC120766912 n=1 Tax=Bactrocera tryoni TaxID=59916 RepID=UPI001A962211|nr:uncharacterized protein LOC120766912 [Bactrocera tryoni]
MRLLNYLSCVLIIVALYGARVTIAILAAEDRANATPGTDTFLATPTRENIESTPRPISTAYKAANCLTNSLISDSVYCRGSRAIRNVIKNLNRRDKPLVLMRGLEIVPIEPVSNSAPPAEPALESDDTFLGYVSEYLRSHELNIKFADLLADESERYLSYDVERNAHGDGVQEARKKDKGQGMILAMAMMFGKMMAVMSLGGIGAMAMKALGVAMTALMLAGLVGMKSLMHSGHESSHSVQYLSGGDGHHHMRRRRSSYDPLRLPYRGWQQKLAE